MRLCPGDAHASPLFRQQTQNKPPLLLGWANKDTKQNGGRWSHLEGGVMRRGLSVKLLGRPWISSVVAWPRTPLRSFRQLPRTKTAAVFNSSTSKACARRTVTAHWSISIQTAPPSPRPPLLNMPQGILAVLMNTSCLRCQTTHEHTCTSNSDEKFMMRSPLVFRTQRGRASLDNNYLTRYCPIVGWASGPFVPFPCL